MRSTSNRAKRQYIAVFLSPSTNLHKRNEKHNVRRRVVWKSFIDMCILFHPLQTLMVLVLTCCPSNQTRYGMVVFSPSCFASLWTSERVPVNGITESWSPLVKIIEIFKKWTPSFNFHFPQHKSRRVKSVDVGYKHVHTCRLVLEFLLVWVILWFRLWVSLSRACRSPVYCNRVNVSLCHSVGFMHIYINSSFKKQENASQIMHLKKLAKKAKSYPI